MRVSVFPPTYFSLLSLSIQKTRHVTADPRTQASLSSPLAAPHASPRDPRSRTSFSLPHCVTEGKPLHLSELQFSLEKENLAALFAWPPASGSGSGGEERSSLGC